MKPAMTTNVAIYLRCSSPEQEASIEQQRKEVLEFCAKKDYRIVATYIDEGRSGSKDAEKRVEFNRMIADLPKGKFSVVVVWNFARFSREDSQEASKDKLAMRAARVVLDSVKDGIADWETSTGRIMDAIKTEGNHQFSRDLSASSLRARAHFASLGFWPVGQIPYGYDRHYTDGKHSIEVKRDDRTFKKGRNWHLKLIVNEEESKIVEEIFKRLYTEGISKRALALDLNSRGIPSPEPKKGKGMGWSGSTIKGIVKQKAYIGVAVLGGGRRVRKKTFNNAERQEKEGACPAIITDRELWNEVHRALERKADEGRKPHFNKSALMSGFVVCGHCNYRMDKREKNGRVIFVCSSGSKRQHLGCRQWQISQNAFIRDTMDWLVESVNVEILKSLQATPKEKDTAVESRLKKEEKRLRDKVTNATEAALTAPEEHRKEAWEAVGKWKDELTAVQTQLQAIANVRSDTALKGLADWWESEKTYMVNALTRGLDVLELSSKGLRLRKGSEADEKPLALATAEMHKLRELLAKLGFTLKVWWKHTPEDRKKDRTKSEWTVCRQEIACKIPMNSENASGSGSNRCSHERSRDKR